MATEDDTNPEGNPEGGGAGGGTGTGGGSAKTFATEAEYREAVKAEVNRIVPGRVSEASRNAVRDALKELGIEGDLDSAKGDIEKWRKDKREAMTEADRIRTDAEAAQKRAEEAERSANEKAHRVLVESALLRAGLELPPDDDEHEDERQEALAEAVGMVRVKVGDDAAAVKDAVKGLKARWPALFEEATEPRKRTPAGGDAPSRKREPKTVKDLYTLGEEMFDPFRQPAAK